MQICSNCGAENVATAKFCTTCGAPLAAKAAEKQPEPTPAAPAQPAQPAVDPAVQAEIERQRAIQAQLRAERMAHLKKTGSGYWSYLVDSWAHPTEVEGKTYNSWLGTISMVIWAVLGAFSIGHSANAGVSRMEDFSSSLGEAFGMSETANAVNSSLSANAMAVYFKIFLLLLAGMFAFGGIGYVFRKWAQKDQISFLDYTTDLMHRSNLNIILIAFVAVMSLVGGVVQLLTGIAVILGANIFFTAFTTSIILPRPRAGFDSVYMTILATFTLGLGLFFLSLIFGQSVMSQVTGFIR